jgi:hypothetical protein
VSGHTQFPWRAERMSCQKDTHLYNYEVVNDQRSIAILLTERDAKLLAAGPELLAACEQALKRYESEQLFGPDRNELERAIKKAKGE